MQWEPRGPKLTGNSFTCTQNVRETENIPQNYSPISQLRFLTVCWSWLWQSIPRINGCRNTIFQRKIQILTKNRIIIILATSKLTRMACVFLRYFCFRQVFHPSDLIPFKLFGAKSMSWVRCLNVKNKTTFSLRFWCVWKTHRFSPAINNSAAWKKGREEV